MSQPKKRPQATLVKVAENLYRNESSGTYYALVKRSGKQIRRSLKTKDRKLADRRLRTFQNDMDRVDPAKGRVNISFKEMSERWLATVEPHLKSSTYLRRKTALKALYPYFGSTNLRSITKRQCEDWASKRGPKRTASTFNKELETLIAVLKYAEGEGILLKNPAAVVKKRKRGKTNLIIPTQEQLLDMLKYLRRKDIRYNRSADLIELLAWSGMRKGEANAFKWRDIDWKRQLFAVTGGETGTKNHDVRMVPLFPSLAKFLKGHKSRHEEWGGDTEPDSLVVGVQTAKKGIDKACKDLELPHFNHHSMRHFFVSMAIEKNIDFKTIAAWVGHKDGGILVAQTYGHLRDTHSMEMAKLMEVN
jgi:integrase